MKMNIPAEILIIIFNQLIIIDQRNLVRCNKHLYQLYPLLKKYELEFLKLIHESKFISGYKMNIYNDNIYALESVYYGREDILEKYIDNKTGNSFIYRSSKLYYNLAARNSSICKLLFKKYSIFTESIMNGVASSGNLELLKWIRKKGYEITLHVSNTASINGQLEVLKWIYENDNTNIINFICEHVAKYGYLEILKWAREKGFAMDRFTCSNAALNNHIEILKWAYENGCPWDESTCKNLALNGQLAVLKWARENGCPWNYHVCANAAKNGDLEMLK